MKITIYVPFGYDTDTRELIPDIGITPLVRGFTSRLYDIDSVESQLSDIAGKIGKAFVGEDQKGGHKIVDLGDQKP